MLPLMARKKIQWHPLFARLLRPQVERYYEIRTEMPVSDVPRKADLVLLRRLDADPLPFRTLRSYLAPWNALEFKGRTKRQGPLTYLGLWNWGWASPAGCRRKVGARTDRS